MPNTGKAGAEFILSGSSVYDPFTEVEWEGIFWAEVLLRHHQKEGSRCLERGRVKAITGGKKQKGETFCSYSLSAQLPGAKDTACESRGKQREMEERKPGK